MKVPKNSSELSTPLVAVAWLAENINNADVVVLDATIPKASSGNNQNDLSKERIPGARFFDIKNAFSIPDAVFPNTRVDGPTFNRRAQQLGIHNESLIVVYDDHGIYSSARAWWMFKSMGHGKVAVLDGGLPAWKDAGFDITEESTDTYASGNFEGQYDATFFKDSQDVFENLENKNELVIDARASDRFQGLVAEPRKGLRSGHIPHSKNIPYTDLLINGKMKSVRELSALMEGTLPKDAHVTFSCGSGITACVLALGASVVGRNEMAVYDGSWTEWGSIADLPIETGK